MARTYKKATKVKFTQEETQQFDDWHIAQAEELRRRFDNRFKPKTKNQEEFWKTIDSSTIIFILGPSGTGKSSLSVSKGIEMLLDKRIKQLVITRPIVSCGEELGILPGNVYDKVSEYLAPILGYFEQFLDKKTVEKFFRSGIIKIVPISLIRGYTFHDTFVIIDECQNIQYGQALTILSRIGENSKMIFCGDLQQSDLNFKRKLPIENITEKLIGIDEQIKMIKFDYDDILRNPLIRKIIAALT